MPLANRALVRYAADALVACGIQDIAIAVSGDTVEDVGEQIGDGRPVQRAVSVSAAGRVRHGAGHARRGQRSLGDQRPMIVHSGDALVTAGLGKALEDFRRSSPDVLLISEPSHSFPEATVVGARSAARRSQFAGLDNVSPAAILSPARARRAGRLQRRHRHDRRDRRGARRGRRQRRRPRGRRLLVLHGRLRPPARSQLDDPRRAARTARSSSSSRASGSRAASRSTRALGSSAPRSGGPP